MSQLLRNGEVERHGHVAKAPARAKRVRCALTPSPGAAADPAVRNT
jgi:hypothetical protein